MSYQLLNWFIYIVGTGNKRTNPRATVLHANYRKSFEIVCRQKWMIFTGTVSESHITLGNFALAWPLPTCCKWIHHGSSVTYSSTVSPALVHAIHWYVHASVCLVSFICTWPIFIMPIFEEAPRTEITPTPPESANPVAVSRRKLPTCGGCSWIWKKPGWTVDRRVGPGQTWARHVTWTVRHLLRLNLVLWLFAGRALSTNHAPCRRSVIGQSIAPKETRIERSLHVTNTSWCVRTWHLSPWNAASQHTNTIHINEPHPSKLAEAPTSRPTSELFQKDVSR